MAESTSAPLRVGLVIGQLSTGGAEGQLRVLCEGFDRCRIAPTVYCLSAETAPVGAQLQRAGVAVRVLAGGRIGRVGDLRRALIADDIQVAHAWLFIANAYAWAATRGGGPALVASARNCKRSGRMLDAVNRRAFRASSAIVVNSERVGRYIEREYGAPHARIDLVYNAIDLDRFHPRPDSGAGGGSAPRIVMIGRLVMQKNPRLFVEGARRLRALLPAARFHLVGDGPLRPDVERWIADAGLGDCVELLGERSDVPELLRAADLFWLTSDWEGLPNVVLEAMASGLPVVATDVGGTAELFTSDVEGALIAAGDCEALVARSAAILTDAGRLAAMRTAARRRAEAFSVPRMVAATEAVYVRALAGRAA